MARAGGAAQRVWRPRRSGGWPGDRRPLGSGQRVIAMALDVSVRTRDGEVVVPTQQRPAPPCAIVIFGASGDLTHRKLMPALFDLFQDGLLTRHFVVLGFSRSPLSDDDFRRMARDGLAHRGSGTTPLDDKAWEQFSNSLHYISGQFNEP